MLETAHEYKSGPVVVMFQVVCLCFGRDLRGGRSQRSRSHLGARARPLNARDLLLMPWNRQREREQEGLGPKDRL